MTPLAPQELTAPNARSLKLILKDYKRCAYVTQRGSGRKDRSQYIAVFEAQRMTDQDVAHVAAYFSELLHLIQRPTDDTTFDIAWCRCGPQDHRQLQIIVSGPVSSQEILTKIAWGIHRQARKNWAGPPPSLSDTERRHLLRNLDRTSPEVDPSQRLPHVTLVKPVTGLLPAAANSPWLKLSEDWWAVMVGLALVLAAIVSFRNGSSINWIAVTPAKWSSVGALLSNFAADAPRYIALFALWTLLVGLPLKAMGFRAREFLPAFGLISVLSILIFAVGQWTQSDRYDLEPPLIALVLGLLIANFRALPAWMDAGFRVEYFIKTGIVLLGATIPLTLLVLAGPTALVQASLVSLVTFAVIYLVGTGPLGLDRRLTATLAAGGAICGVSAAIAVAGAVGAKKQDAPVAITLVIAWAIVLIFLLPYACEKLGLPAAVAGAWIGTSELADAAGLAAAQTVAGLAEHGKITGSPESAITAFTLVKVLGRDVWIGIWAFVLSLAATGWEGSDIQATPNTADIWRRFPKFVLGFLAASFLVTAVTVPAKSYADFMGTYSAQLLGPIKNLRTWAFIFTFLSIGLTTRVRDLAGVGTKPLLAFTAGVVVNVLIGWLLSVAIFYTDWQEIL